MLKLRATLSTLLIGLLGFTACTPEQMAAYNRLTPDQKIEVAHHLTGLEVCREESNKNQENCELGWSIAKSEGLTAGEFECVDNVVMRESGWYNVPNAAGGSAYGIPQALPGKKMSTHGADWRSNPETQIRWMLDYFRDRYGSFCAGWRFKQANGWY